MKKVNEISLFVTIISWAMIIGGVMYSHIVYFPPYLANLPESNRLITGQYGLKDSHFWLSVHPLVILSTVVALILNWKQKTRRKLIMFPLAIYALAILATALYFVPNLMAFADSNNIPNVTPTEWAQRGQTWQHWSWIRGSFLLGGFVMLLVGLTKNKD